MQDSIIVYSSPTCSQCMALKTMLKQKGIEFSVCEDTQLMLEKGFTGVPQLEHNGQVMNFKESLGWLKSR